MLSISMTRRERLLGWSFFPVSLLVLPLFIGLISSLLRVSLSLTVLNILYFTIDFVCIVGIFYRFLWESLKAAWAKRWKCLLYAFEGLCMYFVCMLMVSVIITPWVGPNFSNVNDSAIAELSNEHTGIFIFCAVLLVPVVEETLHRGLVFQSLYRKTPGLALCVSALFFAGIHLIDYIGTTDWNILLACFVQYLPAGIILAGSYAISDTIIVPILMHAVINLIGFVALR